MLEIYRSLKTAEVWIYIILFFCSIFPLRKLLLAVHEYRGSLFGMEKDNARAKVVQSGSLLVLLVILATGVFVFVTFAGSKIPAIALLPTPTADIQSTLTPVGNNSESAGNANQNPQVETPAVNGAGGSAGVGCIPGKVEWSYPKPGDEITGNVELKGTASIENFGFYKYEYSQDNTNWISLQAGVAPVKDGVIGNWDTSVLTSGDYQLRLIVTNNTGEEIAPCLVQVKVIQK